MSFVHLHVHSSYSVLDGMSRLEELVDKSLQYNMPGIALTDHGSMYGVVEFLNYVEKVKKNATVDFKAGKISEEKLTHIKNFKPIVGVEAYCAARSLYDKDKNKKTYSDRKNKEVIVDMSGFHLILLAKNKIGYQNLCKLVSKSWIDGFYQKPRIDKTILEQHKEGLIVSSACLGGEIPQLILNNQLQEAEDTIKWFKDVFGDDFYLEVQLHKPTRADVSNEIYLNQQKVNEEIFSMAEKTGTKVIATNDVHFVCEEDADAHERLVCLSTGKKISDNNRLKYSKEEYLKTPEQMMEIFKNYPETISNTLEINDKISIYSLNENPIMPKFNIPQEFGTIEEYRERFSDDELIKEFSKTSDGKVLDEEESKKRVEELGGVNKLYQIKLEADYLHKLTYDGAKERYANITPELEERIDFELNTIKTMGFPGYFLIVQDFVKAARDIGVWVGPGRGSAAGSVVAYCLKIININPLEFDLLFERFLNPDRISLPDIDVDFDNDGLPKVLDWVTEKYGKECVAHIINYGKMATKLAITDVGRIQEIPLSDVNKFKAIIPDSLEDYKDKKTEEVPKLNIKNLLKYSKEVQQYCKDNPNIAEMMKYAEQLEGTVRQTGVHACGIIIAPDDLTNFLPLSTAKDKDKDNMEVPVTQYDGHVIEKIGLIKMDFLALKTLSIMKEAVANIKKSQNIDIDINNLDWNDKKVFELFSMGNTIGIFQFESSGMRKYLKDLQPTTLEDIIAMNALYRPGPMQYIPDFIDRKHGRMPIRYDIPIMEKYLQSTYGVTVYQEQVMLLSREIAGFSRGDSDQLRKGMGKKIKPILMELKPKFINGGEANGYSKAILEKIWSDWEKFAAYAFNKSHSTCYAVLAYQTAYLKAHYPAEFMAANLSLNKGKIVEIIKLMEECKSLKIPLLLPDVNESETLFTVNSQGAIRFGLGGIKNVGEATVESIIQERKENGNYKSLFDFLERSNLKTCNKKAIESLVLSGAFDNFTEIKREDYFQSENTINSLLDWGRQVQASKISLQNSLFGADDLESSPRPNIPKADEWSDLKKLSYEKDLIGVYLSAHPLDKYKAVFDYGFSHSIRELKNIENEIKQFIDAIPNNKIITTKIKDKEVFFSIGGMIINAETNTSKRGNTYGKFTLEDYSDQISLTLFDGFQRDSKYFSKFRDFLVKDIFVEVRGSIRPEIRQDKINQGNFNRNVEINITNIELLTDDLSSQSLKNLSIEIELHKITDNLINELNSFINANTGKTNLFFGIYNNVDNTKIELQKTNYGISINNVVLKKLEEMSDNNQIKFSINNRGYISSKSIVEEDTDDTPKQEIVEVED